MTQIKEDMSSDDKLLRLFGSVILLGIVSVYFFFSTIPHGFNNLKNASYTEFKTGKVLAVEAPFLYHPDYLDILFWVNIDDAKKRDFINEQVSSVIAQRVQGFEKMSISQVVQLLKEINASPKPEIQAIRPEAKQSLLRLYEGILEPTDVYKNTAYIYRIGTFLKYYISENDRRLFEDSLVSQFNTYIYDTNLDIAVQRMKYLGLRYLLVDLNAATIDRDPEHRLTARYENLLRTFTSEKLTLIRSDSLCLELALDLYRTSQKTEQDMMDYLMLAGANHESYFDGKEINRGVKQVGCYQKMINLINEGKVTDQSFSYLKGVQAYLTNPDNASQFQSEQDVLNFFRQYVKP
ncbi:MAG: hypothetical protein H6767_09890 [Candidatus Peribacteria bacterium]|nr:MAG: hypothetical protein H6767_09890 [Candidatus Peribacteria bacterium]